jgi:hypothetical protein
VKDAILARLEKLKGPDHNGEYTAICPFHKDTNPSLNVNFEKGVYKCFGCESSGPVSRLAMALGIPPNRPERQIEAVYDYTDSEGKVLFQAVRYSPKGFSQRRPDGAGGWVYDLKGVRRVLYRLPEVLEAVRKGVMVYIVEGEKDADNLVKLGLVATTSPMGAGKWKPEYSETLTGANVVILPDTDEPGRKHAAQVAQSLAGKAKSIKVVELPGEGVKDASDWLQAGGNRAELEHLVSEAKALEPKPHSTFNLTKLSDLLAEPAEDIAFVWADTLPRGGLSLLVAKPKVGKSTFARNLALKVARGDGEFLGRAITTPGPDVLFLLEEKRSEVKKHFERMGAGDLPILVHIGSAPEQALEELRKVITDTGAVFCVVDPLQRLVRIPDLNDYSSVSLALEPLEQIARTTGCHIMLIHHANKGIGREGGDMILGSTALFGGVDCALIMRRTENHRTIESIQRYGEDLPRTVLSFDPVTGVTTSGGTLEDAQLAECGKDVLEFLANREPTSETDIKENIPVGQYGRGLISKALRKLKEQGRVERHGSGKRNDPYLYSLTVAGVSGFSGCEDMVTPNKPSIFSERDSSPIPSQIVGCADSGKNHENKEMPTPRIQIALPSSVDELVM